MQLEAATCQIRRDFSETRCRPIVWPMLQHQWV